MTQPRWLALAWGDLGIAETPGPQHTERVVRYYADVGHAQIANDETAWCAAFVGSCLERAGIASTRSLLARSYLDWGMPAASPQPGTIAVLSRGNDPLLGHVAFVVGSTPNDLILLGGNQSDAVSVDVFPRARLLALRWPTAAAEAPASPRSPDSPEVARGEAAGDPVPGSTFEHALAHILQMEGGWADDPYDPGGPTNFGITLATYAKDKGVAVTADNFAQLKSELRSLRLDTVRRIYLESYWQPAACPVMPPALAFFHFDAAVNHGVLGAARLLQETVGAVIDGEIGPETLGKGASRPGPETLALYADVRRRHYRSLSTFWRFGNGWLARIDRTLAAALQLPFAPPSRNATEPKETPMANAPAPAPTTAPDTKWWGHSMTVWGVVMTTLSAVLPTLGPILGLNITADLVQQLGDQLVAIVQALGALVGTLLTIYGRMRATVPLSATK
jgi:uncharacterized protein (TIGR02594 family)